MIGIRIGMDPRDLGFGIGIWDRAWGWSLDSSCDVDLDWDINRVVKNFQTLNVIIYQELTTDIKGNPN